MSVLDPNSTQAAETSDPLRLTLLDSRVTNSSLPGLDLRGYEFVERLGAGGMGEVYRASDPALGRDLAVKVMKADSCRDAEAEGRFLREAYITGSLQHPCIVPVHNLGRLADGRLHYTMQVVRGQTFAALLKQAGGRPEFLSDLLAIFEKVCQATAYAHSKRVIHRDLKPSNVMVGRFGEVQVMDWGLAKHLDANNSPDEADGPSSETALRGCTPLADTPWDLSQTGRGMGTPAYMPPEQARGEWGTVDERADVFALGAILCEILTGRPPFTNSDKQEVLQQAGRGDVTEALSRLQNCGADKALVALCQECLTPQREGRPRDAGAVAQRVAAYLTEVQHRLRRAELERAEALVEAREERRRRRWVRTAALILVAGVVLSTSLAVWAIHAQKQAQASEGRALQAEQEANTNADKAKAGEMRAENEKTRAKESESAMRAVLAFFQKQVLAAARPKSQDGGLGVEATIRAAVDAAEPKIAEMFQAQPFVEAEVRQTLGITYSYLGEGKLALPQFERALALRRTQLGPDHPDTLTSMSNLAQAYTITGQRGEALQLLEQVLAKRKALLGTDHLDTLLSMNHLAWAYQDVGQLEKALPLFEHVLANRNSKLGPNHPSTLAAMNNLAAAYQFAGQVPKAIPLFKQVLEKQEAQFGPNDLNTLTTMNNLATAYQAVGQVNEAIPILERTLARIQSLLGPNHYTTLSCTNNLGRAYQDAGKLEKALPLLEHVLAKRRETLGPNHPATLQSMENLGVALEDRPERDRGEALLREVIEEERKTAGDSAALAGTLSRLGCNLLKQKKYTEAESILRECLAIREKKQRDDWLAFDTRSLLGEALLGQKEYTEAEPLLLQGYEGMNERRDQMAPTEKTCLSEALDRLVQLYEAIGKSDEAARWRNLRRKFDRDD